MSSEANGTATLDTAAPETDKGKGGKAATIRKRIRTRAAAGSKPRLKMVSADGNHAVTIKAFPLSAGEVGVTNAVKAANGGRYSSPESAYTMSGNGGSDLDAAAMLDQLKDIAALAAAEE